MTFVGRAVNKTKHYVQTLFTTHSIRHNSRTEATGAFGHGNDTRPDHFQNMSQFLLAIRGENWYWNSADYQRRKHQNDGIGAVG